MKPIEERYIYKKRSCSKCGRSFKTNKAGKLPLHISLGHHICKGSEQTGLEKGASK